MMLPVSFNEPQNKTCLIKEDFLVNTNGWEIVDNEKEYAGFEKNGYVLSNRRTLNWTFYHINTNLKKSDSFELTAQIKVLSNPVNGQFGLVWGFKTPHQILNRFAVTADYKRCTVMQFQKDHHRIYHSFRSLLRINKGGIITLKIQKIQQYYFFKINGKLVYLAHEVHFTNEGRRIGFYVEPGLTVAVRNLEVNRLF